MRCFRRPGSDLLVAALASAVLASNLLAGPTAGTGPAATLATAEKAVAAALSDAAEAMDERMLRSLLEQSADVNAAQVDGMTALHWAAYHDDPGLGELLLRAGADPNATNRYGVTPLSLACTNANGAMVRSFLQAGADPNTTLPGGETALMTAARTGSIEAVQALLEAGADLHAKEGRRAQSPLMWGAAAGHAEVVAVLLEAGADLAEPLDSGFTPLLFAAREGQAEVVRALLRAGADVNAAVEDVAERRLSYRAGRPIDVGTTALLLAVTNAHFELAAELLDAGADANANLTGYTALHTIGRVRKPGVGDNNPAPDGSGSMTSLELVRDLVSHGADVNARMTKKKRLNSTRINELGATPFLLAALVADTELMKTLVDLGADPLLTNEENSTALMAAAGLGTRSPGEDAGTEEEVVEALRLLLELGVDPNAVDDNGETAMHGAAYKNLPRAVELLAANGADIKIWNQRNKYGWTPLSTARGYRFGNFKPSPPTVTAVERLMIAEGVVPPTPEEDGAKSVDIYAKPPYKTAPSAAAPPAPTPPPL